MKIHSNLRAGMTFAECDAARNRMKRATENGDCSALGGAMQPSYPTQLPSYPPSTGYYPPQQPNYPIGQQVEAGGYYGGQYYLDRSGVCG